MTSKSLNSLGIKLTEYDAQSGQLILMDVHSGAVKAMVCLARTDSASYLPSTMNDEATESALMQPISILAALETGKVSLTDTVDTGEGICFVHGQELRDHNWERGGYGAITVRQGLAFGSNIATYKTLDKAFGEDEQGYDEALRRMSYGQPDSVAAFMQTLAFYNAIANDGKMILPQLTEAEAVVINPQIASTENIVALKEALRYKVTDGMGRMALSDKVSIAGNTGTVLLEDGSYVVQFCGYFPSDEPRYTLIVSIHKAELPASDAMPSIVAKEVAEGL